MDLLAVFLAATLPLKFADWVQGPFLYRVFQHHAIAPEDIAVLYSCAYASSAVLGTLAGSLGDRIGRKRLTILYGVVFALASATKFSASFWVLLGGRCLNGVATSIMHSAFEPWFLAQHAARGLSPRGLVQALSVVTFAHGLVAIPAGVAGHGVSLYGDPQTPFALAIGACGVGMALVAALWEGDGPRPGHQGPSLLALLPSALRFLAGNRRALLVGVVQSLFEVPSMVFVMMWTPHLQRLAGGDGVDAVPTGLIFAGFMVALMAGSQIHGALARHGVAAGDLLGYILPVAACAFLWTAASTSFGSSLGSFLLFEVACGAYYPVLGALKQEHLPRPLLSTIAAVFRLPLNILLVVGLRQVVGMADSVVFAGCATLLIVGTTIAWSTFGSRFTVGARPCRD